MKRLVKIIALVALSALAVCCFAACGGNSIEGTYKFESQSYSRTADGKTETQAIKVGDTVGTETITAEYMVLTVTKDGKCTIVSESDSKPLEGTWKKSGSGYEFTISNESMTGTLKGSKLTLSSSQTVDNVKMDSEIVFVK